MSKRFEEWHHSRIDYNTRLEPLNIHRDVPKSIRALRSIKQQIVLSDRNGQGRISDRGGIEHTLDVRLEPGLRVVYRKGCALREGDWNGGCRVASGPSEVEHGLVELVGKNKCPFFPSKNPTELGAVRREVGLVGGWRGSCFPGTIVDGCGRDDSGRNQERRKEQEESKEESFANHG